MRIVFVRAVQGSKRWTGDTPSPQRRIEGVRAGLLVAFAVVMAAVLLYAALGHAASLTVDWYETSSVGGTENSNTFGQGRSLLFGFACLNFDTSNPKVVMLFDAASVPSNGAVATRGELSIPQASSANNPSVQSLTILQTNASNSAASGLLRDANNSTTVAARNAANSADIPLIGADASNNVLLGGANANGLKNNVAANFNMNSQKIASLSAGTSSGDSIAFGLNHLNDLATATGTYSMGGNAITGLSLPQTNTANPAGAGLLRDANNSTTVAARNAANSADITLVGTDSSNNITLGNGNANGFKLQNTAYTIIPPTSAPADSGQVWASNTAGVGSWIAPSFELSAGSNTFGNDTTFPANSVIATRKAANAGHFTQLNCINATLNGGSCTTAPTINVFDGTTNTGSTLTCSTTVQTKGNQSTTAQTLTFAAGDIIGMYVSAAGASCTAPIFVVTATATEP